MVPGHGGGGMIAALDIRIKGRKERRRVLQSKDGRKVVVIEKDGLIVVRRWEGSHE